VFLGGLGVQRLPETCVPSRQTLVCVSQGFASRTTYICRRTLSRGPVRLPCRVPLRMLSRCRNSTPAVHRLRPKRPRLRSRLPLGRLPWPRNPQTCGVRGLHTDSRYSFRHSRFSSLQQSSRSAFSAIQERSPTPGKIPRHSVGSWLEPRYVLGAAPLDQ
jgi:hypothetical protein